MTNNNNTHDKSNTMRVSDIITGDKEVMVETTSDARQVFTVRNGEAAKQHYIATHGDVVVVWDEQYKVYRVPAFKAQRDSYSNAKAKDCSRWGSE